MSLSATLTKKREDAGRRFAAAVDAILPELGMEDGHLVVGLTPLAAIGPHGAEDVEFRVALNLGHDLRPLAPPGLRNGWAFDAVLALLERAQADWVRANLNWQGLDLPSEWKEVLSPTVGPNGAVSLASLAEMPSRPAREPRW